MCMKNYALKYQEMGFSVIPINPKNKRPMIEFADKPAMTTQEIELFWDSYPNANIALRCDKFFVIDIDKHGESNGFDSLKKWRYLHLIEPTLQAKTASGGKHIFYFKRDDMHITQMINFLPGVDIKAHVNNYVLVAPSATEKGQYEWDLEKSKKSLTIVTPKKELLDAIVKTYQKNYHSQGLAQLKYASYSNNRQRNNTTELFETIVNGFGNQGGRNDALAKFVSGLLHRCVDIDIIKELAEIANSHTTPPLQQKELIRTINSMMKKDMRGVINE